MPESRGRRRDGPAFAVILTALALVSGAVVLGGYVILRALSEIEVAPVQPGSGCTVQLGEGDEENDELSLEQAGNAATVGGVAFHRDLPEQAVVIAYATVWQESQFYNIDYGDRDSLGLFQQRPSMDWGEPHQLLDPVYASTAFYAELEEVPDYPELPPHEAAQEVQRSVDGTYYARHEDRARDMALAFSGREQGAVYCWDEEHRAAPEPAETVREAAAELERVFGAHPDDVPYAEDPRTGDLGWAMAIWAVAHASEYGLESVTYSGHRWEAATGGDGWTVVDPETADRRALTLR